ncbi:MAG: Asp23/Gls24 family envelope stress response protein [Clostridiales bacterium]|nr:Asp23/Gls24 family envelope stress response protein [Clostridiales bacterium]
MKVIGFVGESGSGKSYRATWLANKKNIDCIIDDGLLIRGATILGGESAKKELTKVGSIKKALFTKDEDAEEMKKIIQEVNPKSILILGTSDGMVDTIAKRLELPKVEKKIYITDIASKYEISQALAIRKEQGKHVIPVPTLEIKKEFSGYFLDPLQIFKKRGSYQVVDEKSVVRPTFSYLGKYTISDYTLYQIAQFVVSKIPGIKKISRFRVEKDVSGIYMDMDCILIYGCIIKEVLRRAQIEIKEEIEHLTDLNIKRLDILAKSLVMTKKREGKSSEI